MIFWFLSFSLIFLSHGSIFFLYFLLLLSFIRLLNTTLTFFLFLKSRGFRLGFIPSFISKICLVLISILIICNILAIFRIIISLIIIIISSIPHILLKWSFIFIHIVLVLRCITAVYFILRVLLFTNLIGGRFIIVIFLTLIIVREMISCHILRVL